MEHIEPTLTRRDGDLGWIASTPESYPLRFAVVAPSGPEAKEKFADTLARWLSIEDDEERGASIVS